MKNLDYFTYKIIKEKQVYFSPYRLSKLTSPFTFILLPVLPFRKDTYVVEINGGETLIYKKRIFGKFSSNTNKNSLENIYYFIGKKSKFKSDFYIIDIKSNKVYHFHDIDEERAFKSIIKMEELV